MKKRILEVVMASLLLVCFFLLSREAAQAVNQDNSKGVIVVDPGHGGNDPGMIGIGGLKEKEINLVIAGKLKAILEEKGYSVVMTRDGDYGLYEENTKNQKAQDLQKRIALIKESRPVLAVSIHQNSYEDESVYGPQVFYYRDSAQGEQLAKCIQASMNQNLAVEHAREAKGNTTYYLLKRSDSVLNIVECGFLTNSREAKLLQEEDYQDQVAAAVAEGICAYLGN